MAKSLGACIVDLKAELGLDPQLEAELKEMADGFERPIKRGGLVPADRARKLAQLQALEQKVRINAKNRQQAELAAIRAAENTRFAANHRKGFVRGIDFLLRKVEQRQKAITARLEGMMVDVLQEFRVRAAGFSAGDPKLLGDMFRELHGTKTGNSRAAELAASWSHAAEEARRMFNRAGGHIAKRTDWGSPQSHDSLTVRKAGRTAWRSFIEPLLDRERMTNVDGVPLSADEFSLVLDEVFDTIQTQGLNKASEGRIGRGGKMANRHRDPRFLVFRDGDAWLNYQQKFGAQDMHGLLVSHLHSMGREIGLMEIMGPNPKHAYEGLRLQAEQRAARGETIPRGLVARGLAKLGMADLSQTPVDAALFQNDNLWKIVAGEGLGTVEGRLNTVIESSRSLLTASKLGTAMLSALSDTAFTALTANLRGMPTMRVFGQLLRNLKPGNTVDRAFAVHLGLGAEGMTARNLAMQRFSDEVGAGRNFFNRAAEATIRASGLNSWTENIRWAFGMDFMHHLADSSSRTFGQLDKKIRAAMQEYGIGAKDWDIARHDLGVEGHKGARYLSPTRLAELIDDELANTPLAGTNARQRLEVATKFQEMVMTEMDFASPMPGAKVRSVVTQGTRRGTLPGAVMAGLFQFKSFPITVMYTHVARALRLFEEGDKGAYAAKMVILTTIGGMVSLQAKQLARGKEARDMKDPRAWVAALVQGGGVGIMGDYLFADVNRFGHDIVTASAGPLAGLISDTAKLTKGNVDELVAGKETDFANEAVRFLEMYTPGSSLWYGRLAFERLIFDQLRRAVDPRAASSFDRIERKVRDSTGQKFWWRPGKAAPEALR